MAAATRVVVRLPCIVAQEYSWAVITDFANCYREQDMGGFIRVLEDLEELA